MGATSNNMLQLKGIFKDRLSLRIQFSFAPLIQKYNIQNNCSELMQLWGTKQWQTRSMAYLHPDLILHIRAPSLLLLRRKVSKATALRVSITFEFRHPFFYRHFRRVATFRGQLLRGNVRKLCTLAFSQSKKRKTFVTWPPRRGLAVSLLQAFRYWKEEQSGWIAKRKTSERLKQISLLRFFSSGKEVFYQQSF